MNSRFVLAVAWSVAAMSVLASSALDLNGSWAFRFENGKSIEEVADPAFAATDTMVVPGCWDTMPQWFLKRGTGLYRRAFTLTELVENAWLVVDGMEKSCGDRPCKSLENIAYSGACPHKIGK